MSIFFSIFSPVSLRDASRSAQTLIFSQFGPTTQPLAGSYRDVVGSCDVVVLKSPIIKEGGNVTDISPIPESSRAPQKKLPPRDKVTHHFTFVGLNAPEC